MNSYDVIVGSNNETGELELDRIISITSKYYDEYMVNPGVVSVNNGEREDLAIIVVTSDESTLMTYMTELRAELNQREVAYRRAGEINSIRSSD